MTINNTVIFLWPLARRTEVHKEQQSQPAYLILLIAQLAICEQTVSLSRVPHLNEPRLSSYFPSRIEFLVQ